MVYIREEINYLRSKFLLVPIQACLYYYLFDKDKLSGIDLTNFGDVDQIAVKGYKGELVDDDLINELLSNSHSKVNFTSNIYTLLGVFLAYPEKIKNHLTAKFNSSSLKHQYLITCIESDFKNKFIQNTSQSLGDLENSNILEIIQLLESNSFINESHLRLIKNFIESSNEVIDLILLEKFTEKLLKENIRLINKEPKELVIQILKNFDNSIRRLTTKRREGKTNFLITDEYDVQDLIYVMLKPIFPTLDIEDPSPKVGGASNRIDLVIPDLGLLIELKMLKQNDTSEKKIIKDLKEDFESYHSYPNIKNLIVFVHDPYKKTQDVNNFNSLIGERTKINTTFYVEIIVN